MHRLLPAVLTCLAVTLPAAAQDVGGLSIAPGALVAGGPTGLARPLPFVLPSITARDIQGSMKATNRSDRHQQMVARVRGDAGYLGGFSLGTPLSSSVQPLSSFDDGGRRRRPHVTINNFEGPVAVTEGNGNVIQQQQASSVSGPVALQQLSNGQPTPGGAVNVVGPDGSIVQHSARSLRR